MQDCYRRWLFDEQQRDDELKESRLQVDFGIWQSFQGLGPNLTDFFEWKLSGKLGKQEQSVLHSQVVRSQVGSPNHF